MGEAHYRDDVEAFLSTLCSLFVHRSLDNRKEIQNRPIISILYTLTSLRVASSSKWVHICQTVNPPTNEFYSYLLFLRLHKTPWIFVGHTAHIKCANHHLPTFQTAQTLGVFQGTLESSWMEGVLGVSPPCIDIQQPCTFHPKKTPLFEACSILYIGKV